MRMFGVVGLALAFQFVLAVQLLLLPVFLFRRLYWCGVNLLVFAQRVYACCEVVCTFFLHAPQLIAHTIFVCCIYGKILLYASEVMRMVVFARPPAAFCFSPVLMSATPFTQFR